MDLTLLFRELENAGITLFLDDSGALKYSAPKGALTDERLCMIREHREAIVEKLTQALPEPWTDANAAWKKLRRAYEREGIEAEEAGRRARADLGSGVEYMKRRAAGEPVEKAMQSFIAPPPTGAERIPANG